MSQINRIQVTKMVWDFSKDGHQKQVVIHQSTEDLWLTKLTAIIYNDAESHIRYEVEVYGPNGILPSTHAAIQARLSQSLYADPDITGIEEEEQAPAKHVAVIHFHKQTGVNHIFRAFDGFVKIVRSLATYITALNNRPVPEITQHTIIEHNSARITFGDWMDRKYFEIPKQGLYDRLVGAIDKQVRLRVLTESGTTAEHVGILGVIEHKGWTIGDNTTKYWPLVCVEWVDVLSE